MNIKINCFLFGSHIRMFRYKINDCSQSQPNGIHILHSIDNHMLFLGGTGVLSQQLFFKDVKAPLAFFTLPLEGY